MINKKTGATYSKCQLVESYRTKKVHAKES